MLRKLYKINPTTFEDSINGIRTEIGDKDKQGFVPACKIYNFDDETFCTVRYNNKRYALVGDPEATELDKLILSEAVEYPPYEIGKWYNIGDLLEYNNELYEVVQGHTSQEDWPPDVVSNLYTISTPPWFIRNWVQPEGSHDAKALGTKVYHNEKIWVSIINDNVWEPGVYGWEESSAGESVELYPVDNIKNSGVQGLEFEVVLDSRPSTNVISFNIETEGLKFHYQRELTQAEIDEGHFQPENVIGSYAVYHATQGNMHQSQVEAEKYKTGKAFHIYRPQVADANGNTTWGKLNIDADSGVMSITVDGVWLDNAVYPVKVDPTFGYTTLGGYVSTTWGAVGSSYLIGDSGTLNTITAWFGYSTIHYGTYTMETAVYNYGTTEAERTFIQNSETQIVEIQSSADKQWRSFNITPTNLDVNTWYVLVLGKVSIDPNNSFAYTYDELTGTDTMFFTSATNVSTGWPSTISTMDTNGRCLSIYGTYEERGPTLSAVQESATIKLTWTY